MRSWPWSFRVTNRVRAPRSDICGHGRNWQLIVQPSIVRDGDHYERRPNLRADFILVTDLHKYNSVPMPKHGQKKHEIPVAVPIFNLSIYDPIVMLLITPITARHDIPPK